jgi:hypothetical protein
MILLAPLFCWYVFWKSMFKELGMEYMIPVVDMPMNYMVMCSK